MTLAMFFCATTAVAHSDHDHHEQATLLERAVAAQAHHEFDKALALVERALRADPADDAARLHAMALHLIQGNADGAEAACNGLRAVPPVVMATCHARVAHARGEVSVARARLERLLAVSPANGLDAALYAWTLSVAGDLALADGDAASARDRYHRSLVASDNAQVRASLVERLIESGDWAAAKSLVSDGARSLTLTVQQLIIDRALGLDTRDREQRVLATFERWELIGDYEHAREMARFYLDVRDDPERALALARINARLQKEPEDGLLLERARAASVRLHK
ncbi:MAG: hypothetical protein AAFU65_09955 [Pseudomonadota bacterium]